MKIAVFSTKSYDESSFRRINEDKYKFDCQYYTSCLTESTAHISNGADVICAFVSDELTEQILNTLASLGTKLIAMCCPGFGRVDLEAANKLGLHVISVPIYSPEAVAEHTVGLMMCLNRHLHKAYQRTRDANFSLEGLTGFNMFGKTVGVIGTSTIGLATMRILKGFGMNILCHDPYTNQAAIDLGAKYTTLEDIYSRSDVITLHCPLSPESQHMLNADTFAKMKDGVMIINTSRGGLLNSAHVIDALQTGKIGALGLDLYDEDELFLQQDKLNNWYISNDVLRRLTAFPNVIITGHQSHLTHEALDSIAASTLEIIDAFNSDGRSKL